MIKKFRLKLIKKIINNKKKKKLEIAMRIQESCELQFPAALRE